MVLSPICGWLYMHDHKKKKELATAHLQSLQVGPLAKFALIHLHKSCIFPFLNVKLSNPTHQSTSNEANIYSAKCDGEILHPKNTTKQFCTTFKVMHKKTKKWIHIRIPRHISI